MVVIRNAVTVHNVVNSPRRHVTLRHGGLAARNDAVNTSDRERMPMMLDPAVGGEGSKAETGTIPSKTRFMER